MSRDADALNAIDELIAEARYKEAKSWLDEMIERQGSKAALFFKRASVQSSMGESEGAKSDLREGRLLCLGPTGVKARQAYEAWQADDYSTARSFINEALALRHAPLQEAQALLQEAQATEDRVVGRKARRIEASVSMLSTWRFQIEVDCLLVQHLGTREVEASPAMLEEVRAAIWAALASLEPEVSESNARHKSTRTAVYWYDQDEERLQQHGCLSVSFFGLDDDPDDREIGRRLQQALEEQNLATVWFDDPREAIMVLPIMTGPTNDHE